MIALTERRDQVPRLLLARLGLCALQGRLRQRTPRGLNALGKGRGTTRTVRALSLRLLRGTRAVPWRLGRALLGLGLAHRAGQRQAGRFRDLMLQMKEIRGVMGLRIVLDVATQRLRLVAGALNDRDRQSLTLETAARDRSGSRDGRW
jgi:hypothetical protein